MKGSMNEASLLHLIRRIGEAKYFVEHLGLARWLTLYLLTYLDYFHDGSLKELRDYRISE